MANYKTFRVSLDMKAPTAQRNEWEVVEGDNGNIIEITLTDDGEPVDLTGCKVLAVFGLPTGVTVEQDTDEGSVTIGGTDNNVITIALKTGSFSPGKSSSGLMKCEIQVYSGVPQNTLITSAQFTFRCRRAIMNDDTIAATDEYPVLVELIEEVQQLMVLNQSDWDEADPTDPAYIQNKPTEMDPTAHAASHQIDGTDALPAASTSTAGLVQLYDGVDSSSTSMAATAAAAKAAYDKSLKYYKSVTELGLTSGSATIAGVFAAMENNSIAWIDAAQFANGQTPNALGFVEAHKIEDSRASIFFWGKASQIGDYRMGINDSNVPDGTWVKIPNGSLFLGSSYDLNDLRGPGATGFYEIGQNLPNSPASWCWFMVIGGTGTIQIAFAPNKIYIRAYTGNPLAWTAWKSITLS